MFHHHSIHRLHLRVAFILTAKPCVETKVNNSDRAVTGLTGSYPASVMVTCDVGWVESNTLQQQYTSVCQSNTSWNPVYQCQSMNSNVFIVYCIITIHYNNNTLMYVIAIHHGTQCTCVRVCTLLYL